MTIVLPIVFAAACLGLFAKRVTPTHWAALVFWIALVIGYHLLKH